MLYCRSVLGMAALAAFVALVGPVFSQDKDKVDLKWKFEKDKTFYQEMTTDTTQTMKIMGMDVTQKQKQTFTFSWTPKEQDKDKNWVVQQKIEAVKMDIDIGGNKIAYDSTSSSSASNALSDFFKALVGAEFTLTINPDGKILKIDGRDKFLEKLVQANPQMKSLLDQILSEKAMEQMADPLFAVVPNKEIAKGDSWKRESKLNLGPIGGYDTTYDYTYEGKEKDFDKIKVVTNLKYTEPRDTSGGGLPFRIKSADLKAKEAGGTILFDNKNGRVESEDLSLTLEGKLQIEIGGMTTEVELKQVQKTIVKTMDKDPIGKKS